MQRNYEAALKKAGATLLYDCNERDRGCLRRGGADTYVTVYTVDVRPDAKPFGGLAASYLQIVQAKPMNTGKAELKPESKVQLDEMAKLLKQNAALKVFIVGHTDNQGGYESNVALSQRRAESIVNALAKDHKIDTRRLAARGAANISPVASNGSKAGRAKNRRVELVLASLSTLAP